LSDSSKKSAKIIAATKKWTRTKADKKAVKKGCWFDVDAGLHAVNFIETYLRHSKGRFAREPFILEPWQRDEIIMPLFGWKNADGFRRFRMAYISTAKKNGKSTLGAAIELYLGIADGEPGAEVYSAATTRKQAKIIWEEAVNMATASPDLAARLSIQSSQNRIRYPEGNAWIDALSAEAGASEGLNIHGLVFDELHVLKDRKFWNSLRYGGTFREEPLTVIVTTAGSDKASICYEIYEKAKKIISGVIEDETFFAFIAECDAETDDWKDPKVWKKANPALGSFIPEKQFEADFKDACESKTKEMEFKRYKLNMWVSGGTRWINEEKWAASAGNESFDEMRESLKGLCCVGGLDLGSVDDLTSLCLLFIDPEFDAEKYELSLKDISKVYEENETSVVIQKFKALWWHWCPRETAKKRHFMERIPYLDWEENGTLELTEGNETDFGYVRARINQLADDYSIQEIAIDRTFQGVHICQQLRDIDGIVMTPFGQGYYSFAGPTYVFEHLYESGLLNHGNSPMMNWQSSNISVRKNEQKLKPDKEESGGKIDGIVSCIMAVGIAMERPPDVGISIYNQDEKSLWI